MRSVAIFGGSFNPPGLHHRRLAEELEEQVDEVIVVPCGPRPDQPPMSEIDPVHRAALADIAFRGLAKTRVELFDLEQAQSTPLEALGTRFAGSGERQRLADTSGTEEASTAIRDAIAQREPYEHLVSADVRAYIHRYGLYRGRIPNRATRLLLDDPRILIFADERNDRARAWATQLQRYENSADPNCIVVLGGDGTMLRAIRTHWRKRLPFLGINAGHIGFLLNGAELLIDGGFTPGEVVVRQMPMLYVEFEKADGSTETALAFNDAWVERTTSQSAWMEVQVNERVRIPKLIADGALVSTAAGSTAYARSMGCPPLLADTPGWLIVGSNVLDPPGWKSALLSTEAQVALRSVGGEKRALRGFVDGQEHGEVHGFRARLSRVAAAELAFTAQHDMAEKIALIQFPPSG